MAMVGVCESRLTEIGEFRLAMLSCAGVHQRKGGEAGGLEVERGGDDGSDARDRLVCVTSGVGYVGLAIVRHLLGRGYSVRLIVANEEDLEKLRKMELTGENETRGAYNSNMMDAVVANFGDVDSLSEAFGGCRGVFHTANLIDPSGLSGYSKSMVEIEVKTCENVMEACGRTPSVRKCVLTSSLLACIWGHHSQLPSIINHNNWTDELVCSDRKLWYALGKLRAEKVAWKVSETRDFKLVSICPGLVTGPQFGLRNPTTSIAYLKGAHEMFVKGLLATVDVNRLAEAHICIYEGMNKTAYGRYICFDRVIQSEEDVENLAAEMGMQPRTILGDGCENSLQRFELSNIRLSLLMSRPRCRNE